MKIKVCRDKAELGKSAADEAISVISNTIEEDGKVHIIVATGQSQFELLQHLTESARIDWSKVVMFHLDEYIGLPITHKASFRKYLQERLVDKTPGLQHHFIDGQANSPKEECARLGKIIADFPIDLALVGIGENGHLAFNDPPADFKTRDPFIVVELDNACKMQQVREGWFAGIEEVPGKAITMSIHQIMASKKIICAVPGNHKAQAVKDCLDGMISAMHPASILQEHRHCSVYLDLDSASRLSNK